MAPQPDPVEAPRVRLSDIGRILHERMDHESGEDAHRDVDVEDPSPGVVVRDPAPERRPEDRRHDDPQAIANGYIAEVEHPGGQTLRVVRTPVQFNGVPAPVGIAPEAGQDTEQILLELGHSWEDIGALKDAGVIP